jgi:hypothetical protein
MAIVFDASSSSTQGTSHLTWTHTVANFVTPKGVLVFIIQDGESTDQVQGVTYGGEPLTEIYSSPNIKASGELGVIYTYFLGTNTLAESQALYVTVSGSAQKIATCITVTADTNITIQDEDATINSNSVADPTCTLQLDSLNSFCAIAFHSGQAAVSGITPLASWTSRLENDFGAATGGVYSYDTIGNSDVTAGWTQTEDDALATAIALREGIVSTSPSSSPSPSISPSPSASWSPSSSISSSPSPSPSPFDILKEDGDHLLKETGDRLLQEQGVSPSISPSPSPTPSSSISPSISPSESPSPSPSSSISSSS